MTDLIAIPTALDDLEDCIRAVYRSNGQECHPALRGRFERDMEVVTKARDAYAELVVLLGVGTGLPAAAIVVPEDVPEYVPDELDRLMNGDDILDREA